jgi:prepilin-type processing-associated H-X9-DG protein
MPRLVATCSSPTWGTLDPAQAKRSSPNLDKDYSILVALVINVLEGLEHLGGVNVAFLDCAEAGR